MSGFYVPKEISGETFQESKDTDYVKIDTSKPLDFSRHDNKSGTHEKLDTSKPLVFLPQRHDDGIKIDTSKPLDYRKVEASEKKLSDLVPPLPDENWPDKLKEFEVKPDSDSKRPDIPDGATKTLADFKTLQVYYNEVETQKDEPIQNKKAEVSKKSDVNGAETIKAEKEDQSESVKKNEIDSNSDTNENKGLTEAEKEKIKKETGWSDEIIEAIGSMKEYEIYKNAGLVEKEINGKKCLINPNIDMNQKDSFGRTNQERMEQGLAPLDKNGTPIELHHIGQHNDSPLAELTQDQHRGKGNDTILHDKTKESEIDRASFDNERQNHWKARAEEAQ